MSEQGLPRFHKPSPCTSAKVNQRNWRLMTRRKPLHLLLLGAKVRCHDLRMHPLWVMGGGRRGAQKAALTKKDVNTRLMTYEVENVCGKNARLCRRNQRLSLPGSASWPLQMQRLRWRLGEKEGEDAPLPGPVSVGLPPVSLTLASRADGPRRVRTCRPTGNSS